MSEQEQEQQQPQEGDEPETPSVEPVTPEEEAEEGEGEGEGETPMPAETPPGAEPGEVVGMDEKTIERMHKRADAARLAYAKKVTDIFGEAASELELCPRCVGGGIPGFIWPAYMAPVDAETKAAVLLSVGEEAPTVSESDSYSRQCETCKGWGRVLSGSKLNAQKTLPCIPCQARGWVAVGDERRVPSQAQTQELAPATNGAPVEQPPDADPWGRGPNDPDYGRLPQFAGAH